MEPINSEELIEGLKAHGARVRLRKNGELHTLDLSDCDPPPNDATIQQLDSLANLEVLDCTGGLITDASVSHLISHRRLKIMTLTGTQISPEGIKRLRQNMIRCRIIT